jgi:exodeoxyribonuclease VII small subunit
MMSEAKPEAKAAAAPVDKLSFEAALQELEQVVARLESGAVPLEESIALYSRGAALRRHCENRLKAAEEQVARIAEGPDGSVTTVPLDRD